MNNEIESTSNYHPARWLSDCLREIQLASAFGEEGPKQEPPSKMFLERCERAAEVALGTAKLRRERQRIGFVPLPIAEYVEGLAKVAEISASPVLAWLGISTLSHIDIASSAGLARLACEVGMSLRELLGHVRISFAAQFDSVPIALLVARQRSDYNTPSELDACEAVLANVESYYDPVNLSGLREIESGIKAAYSGIRD